MNKKQCGDCKKYYTRYCPREPAKHELGKKGMTCTYANSFKDYPCKEFEWKIDYRKLQCPDFEHEEPQKCKLYDICRYMRDCEK